MPPTSFSSTDQSWDKLHAGPTEALLTRGITLLSGQNLTRGTVLGRVAGAVAAAVAAAGNTGDGTVGTVTLGAGAKEGTYRLICIEPAANAGKFQVEDPDGNVVGVATVGVAFAGPINFTIADGAADFVAGDSFTVAVAEGTKYVKSLAAATDGSQRPDAILAEDCDASGGDKAAVAYFAGHFNESALVLGTGHTADSIREGLRQKGIHLVAVQS